MAATIYPFRQALTNYLRDLLQTVAVPNINASLTTNMTGLVDTGSNISIPQLTSTSVVMGDMFDISSLDNPIITIECPVQNFWAQSTDKYFVNFTHSIKLLLPTAGDSTPEDYSLIGQVVIDNLVDVLCTGASNFIKPLASDNTSSVLPYASVYNQCRILRCIGPVLKSNENNTVKYRQWEITHYAETNFYLERSLS